MVQNQLRSIFACSLVQCLVFPVVQKHIVSHATTDITMFNARQTIHCPVDIQQGTMVTI
jgi:hypothetical protein